MKALFVGMSLVVFIMFSMHSSTFAAKQGGALTKLKQLPVVQRTGEALQGTGSSLMYKALAFSMLATATCGTMGCGGDNDPGQTRRATILHSGESHAYLGKNVYLFSDDGGAYLGHVLGAYSRSNGDFIFLVQLTDGTEEIVHEGQIGGHMLAESPDIGAPVEIIGDKTDDILRGIIKSAYGDTERRYYHNTTIYEPVAYWYLVRLDSGKERLVPVASIVAWLEYD